MKHVRESIQAYVSGELDRDRSAAVEAHLADCPECRREAEQAAALWAMLGSVSEDPAVGRSIWPGVRARTVGQSGSSREWLFGGGPWTRTGLATAALAAGLMIGVLVPMGEAPEASASGTDESSWLVDSSWVSGTSWSSEDGSRGLDDLLLGAGLSDEEDGS